MSTIRLYHLVARHSTSYTLTSHRTESDRICVALSYLCASVLSPQLECRPLEDSFCTSCLYFGPIMLNPDEAPRKCLAISDISHLSQWLHTLGSSGFREKMICRREKTMSPVTESAILGPVQKNKGGGIINQPIFPGICLVLRPHMKGQSRLAKQTKFPIIIV